MELIAPAGNLAALKAAVLAGADAVYLGLKNATNARNFAGLNFTEADIARGVAFAPQQVPRAPLLEAIEDAGFDAE